MPGKQEHRQRENLDLHQPDSFQNREIACYSRFVWIYEASFSFRVFEPVFFDLPEAGPHPTSRSERLE
jgi:hypothetical protein